MKFMIALLLLAAPLAAQLQIACAPSDPSFSRTLFDRKTAKQMRHYSCVPKNLSMSPVVISEAELQGFLIAHGVPALSTRVVESAFRENTRRGKWSTWARVMGYVGTGVAAAAAGDWIGISPHWGTAAGLGGMFLPRAGEAFMRRNPEAAEFERLALGEGALPLAPEASVSVSIFSAALEDAPIVIGHVDLGR